MLTARDRKRGLLCTLQASLKNVYYRMASTSQKAIPTEYQATTSVPDLSKTFLTLLSVQAIRAQYMIDWSVTDLQISISPKRVHASIPRMIENVGLPPTDQIGCCNPNRCGRDRRWSQIRYSGCLVLVLDCPAREIRCQRQERTPYTVANIQATCKVILGRSSSRSVVATTGSASKTICYTVR
jgi:hypothetical protein